MRLQRLNMDNTWHFTSQGRSIVIDPWLEGVEIDYFPWFNTQWHRTPPVRYGQVPDFEAVLITQKYPDHFHTKTLETLNPKLVFAPDSLRKQLSRILPDTEVRTFTPRETHLRWGDWSLQWFHTTRRIDPIYDAVLIDNGTQSLFIATHGFQLSEGHQKQLQGASPVHILMSPFNRYRLPSLLGGLVSPGLDGLKTLVQHTQPNVIVRTHDEDKHNKGIVSKLASIHHFEMDMLPENPWLSERYSPVSDYSPVTY